MTFGTYLNSIFNAFSQNSSAQKDMELMGYAYNLGQRSLRESPLNSRKGLEKAGYNPILPFSSGGSSLQYGSTPSAPGVGMSSNPAGDVETILTNAYNMVRQTNAQVDNLKSATAKNLQEAETEANKRANLDSDTLLKQAQAVLTNKESSWVDKKRANEILTNLMNAQSNQVTANAQQMNAVSNSMNAVSNRMNARSNRMSANANQENARTNRWRKSVSVGLKGISANWSAVPKK